LRSNRQKGHALITLLQIIGMFFHLLGILLGMRSMIDSFCGEFLQCCHKS